LLVVNPDNTIASPGLGDGLLGCSLQLAERLLSRVGKRIEYREILESELVSAREVILTGSSGAVWNAISLDRRVIGRGLRGEVVCVLTELWKNHVGIDFVEQAIKLAEVNNY
jgi:branched-subunit amino acid aminotransferase/4-amino-4-deoxychorismate lyase